VHGYRDGGYDLDSKGGRGMSTDDERRERDDHVQRERDARARGGGSAKDDLTDAARDPGDALRDLLHGGDEARTLEESSED
jgi:hypothetical protein